MRGRDRLSPFSHPIVEALIPWLFVGVALVYVVQEQFEPFSSRTILVGAALLLGVGLWRQRSDLLAERHEHAASAPTASALTALALFVLSLPLAVFDGVFYSGDGTAYWIARALVPVLLGWSFFLFLPLRPRPAQRVAPSDAQRSAQGTPSLGRRQLPIVLGLAAATFIVLMVCGRLSGRYYAPDEVLYVLQSRLFSQFEYIQHWDPSLERFFKLLWTATVSGGFYTQYPPGYPAILAVFSWLGARGASGALLGTAVVVFTYLLGRRVHSSAAGLIAAVLVATQYSFVRYSAGYYSHTSTTLVLVIAAWLLVGAEGAQRRARAAQWWVAGLLIGVAITIRPLTGLAVGLSLWLWMVARKRLTPGEIGTMTGTLALGALPACLGLLYYNDLTTGSPWRLGYQAAHGRLHDLGFGIRGFVVFDEQVRPVAVTHNFTPQVALHRFAGTVQDGLLHVLPMFSLMPLLAVGHLYRFPFRWKSVAAFLILPLVYFFYFSNSMRFYLELFPFLFVGMGALIVHVAERNMAVVRSLLTFVLCASVVVGAVRLGKLYHDFTDGFSDSGFPLMQRLREAQREHGRVLVFVRDRAKKDWWFPSLYWYNANDFLGKIVVARDLREENARLVSRLPDHVPMLLTFPEKDRPAQLTRLFSTGAGETPR